MAKTKYASKEMVELDNIMHKIHDFKGKKA
jgi:hypothetical protein